MSVGFVVIVLRDVAWYRASAGLWPALQQVLYWPEIERLAKSEGGPDALV
jgi:hypothetical protein